MRIVCDSCGAKYSIADEKIAGKLFKVRCKKCSEMIMVDGTAMASSDSVPVPGDASGPGSWFVVIDGAQSGPMSSEEVAGQLAAGAIDADTFAWCEGMEDWEPIGSIDAFKDDVARAPVSQLSQVAEVASFNEEPTRVVGSGESPAAAGAFVAAGGAPGAVDSPGAADSGPAEPTPGSSGLFAPAAVGSSESISAFFAASGEQKPVKAEEPADSSFTDERHDSSVLFSLSDLTAKSKSKSSSVPTTEASGLIDIRMLASTPAADQPEGEKKPAGGTLAMAPVVALPTRRSNTPLVLAALLGGVVIIGLLVALYVLMTREPAAPEAPAVAEARPDEVVAEPATPPVAAAQEPVAALAGEGSGEGSAMAAAGAVAGSGEGSGDGAVAEATGDGTQQVAAAAAPTAQQQQAPATAPAAAAAEPEDAPAPRVERREREPAPEPEREETRDSEAVARALDALRRGQDDEPAQEEEEEVAEAAPRTLSRDDIASTIRRYGSGIRGCSDGSEAAVYRVSFVIQPSGRVSNARSDEAGDVPQCLVGVVRDMEFPAFQGDAVPVTYPFRL
jgi:predicted Zn finger-like uncharacterized protein